MIRGERVKLEPWHEGHAEELAQRANDPRIAKHLRDRFPHPYTLEVAHAWIAYCQSMPEVSQFAITLDGTLIGGCGIDRFTDISRLVGEVGFWIGTDYWRKGFATEALFELTTYGFDTLGLARLFAVTVERNPGAAKVLHKIGYSLEGCQRRAIVKDGEIMDALIFAKLPT